MMETQNFSTLREEQLTDCLGGGFAYDVGRVIRFIVKGGGSSPTGTMLALADWIANDVINNWEEPPS
jgi:hypothetical protein